MSLGQLNACMTQHTNKWPWNTILNEKNKTENFGRKHDVKVQTS